MISFQKTPKKMYLFICAIQNKNFLGRWNEYEMKKKNGFVTDRLRRCSSVIIINNFLPRSFLLSS